MFIMSINDMNFDLRLSLSYLIQKRKYD